VGRPAPLPQDAKAPTDPVITVQRIWPDDWRILRDLRLASLADAPYAFTSSVDREASFAEATWRQRLAGDPSFAAFDGDQAIGLAGGVPGRPGPGVVRELVGMWVAAPYRRRGVSRMLFEAVATWATEQGATTLTLGVTEGNHGARAAYLRMGLRPTGVTEPVWNDPTRKIEILGVDLPTPGRDVSPGR